MLVTRIENFVSFLEQQATLLVTRSACVRSECVFVCLRAHSAGSDAKLKRAVQMSVIAS